MRRLSASVAAALLIATPAAAHDWRGFYVGGEAGFVSPEYRGDLTFSGVTLPLSVRASGFTAGAFAGANLMAGPWVYGAEVGASYSRAEDGALGITAGIDWSGSAVARVGYAHDPLMPYALLGISATRGYAKGPGGTDHETRYGLVMGAGLEHALNDRVRIRAEYRYTHGFGRSGVLLPGFTYSDQLDIHRVTVGVSFALGGY